MNDSQSSGEEINDQNDLGDGSEGEESDIAERNKGVQSRIDELTKEKYDLANQLKTQQDKLIELEKKLAAPTSTTPPNPDAVKAIEYLKGLGFAQKQEINQEFDSKARAIQDRMALESEHNRLSVKYDGENGYPAYKKQDVEQFMRDHAVYDPEIAFKALKEAEFFDAAKKQSGNGKREKPYIEKPGSTASGREDNTISLAKIEEWVKTPEGRIKYEQNRQKILQLMTEGKLT